MSVKNSAVTNLEFEVDIFTNATAAQVTIAIIEYLMFQRYQIPLAYPTFKHLISKWQKKDDVTDMRAIMTERQRDVARRMLCEIEKLTEALREEFKSTPVLCVRVLFGTTPLTPYEVYIIKLPNITKSQFVNNSSKSIQPSIRKLLMTLLTSKDLYNIFSVQLRPTNMFVDMQVEHPPSCESEHFFHKEYMDPPRKTRVVTLNVVHKVPDDTDMKNCGDFNILKDVENISMQDGSEVSSQSRESTVTSWREANFIIRGLKEIFGKGLNIWEV